MSDVSASANMAGAVVATGAIVDPSMVPAEVALWISIAGFGLSVIERLANLALRWRGRKEVPK